MVQKKGVNNSPQKQQRPVVASRGKKPHAVWAIDAKEMMQLGDGSWASWLLVVDEASGMILASRAFALKHWHQVDPAEVRLCLQATMETWGMPQAMRFDNGFPWGSAQGSPTSLGLWLTGLQIELLYGRPRVSTDNAIVERAHGVLANWVEPTTCDDLMDLTDRLDFFTQLQGNTYPINGNHTRVDCYPELAINSRVYSLDADRTIWAKAAMLDYLATFRFHRKIEKNGRFSLFNERYYVARRHARETVSIRLDADTSDWMVFSEYGDLIKRIPAKKIHYDAIIEFQ